MAENIVIARYDDVGEVEICRPPHNFFDEDLIRAIARAYAAFERDDAIRAIVLAAQGRSFCAGGRFQASEGEKPVEGVRNVPGLYQAALDLIKVEKPVVAAIQGAATGGGFGLALTADFRVIAPEARFWANFTRLGIHPGFGLTCTLPRLVGRQKASRLMLAAQRVKASEALALGLADELAAAADLRSRARAFASLLGESAPLALRATRQTLRFGLAEEFAAATAREWQEQQKLFASEDHAEGVRAINERRPAKFRGR